MTNTLTSDAKATIEQILRCVDAGAELVRVSVPDVESTAAIAEIVRNSPVPIVADVHFHYKRGIEAVQNGAHCIRINPGTIGTPERAAEVVKAVKDYGASIRIGVNAGSLEPRLLEKYGSPCPEALVESAMDSVKILEDLDFFNTKISVKASDVMLMIRSYEMLSAQCDYPLHLGVTEAGSHLVGSVKSAMGMGYLLSNGIGDTIRVSLSVPPEEELPTAWETLKALHLRARGVTVISCPSCARQQFDVIKVVAEVEKRTMHIKKPITVSILGCVVNGLGEAMHTQIGVTGAGSGNHLIYMNGEPSIKCTSDKLPDTIVDLIRQIAAE
jgi:(E)-4-hydroxy-3-methylbut-2-enyl-diphosphate synthase